MDETPRPVSIIVYKIVWRKGGVENTGAKKARGGAARGLLRDMRGTLAYSTNDAPATGGSGAISTLLAGAGAGAVVGDFPAGGAG